ncbi:DUF192 domain-containing protein [Candidatus Omnitrophota bacterium]
MMKIINKTRNTILAENASLADTCLKRLKGLLGRKQLKRGEALVIKPCSSIHTFFMRFAIDTLFIDKEGRVVALKKRLRPWRMTPVYWKADLVIELPAGVIDEASTGFGDEVRLS